MHRSMFNSNIVLASAALCLAASPLIQAGASEGSRAYFEPSQPKKLHKNKSYNNKKKRLFKA